jgi:hypothetical protein
VGYVSQGSYTVYDNVDFGASVSQVNVRTASDGNGGAATFYLDNMTNRRRSVLLHLPQHDDNAQRRQHHAECIEKHALVAPDADHRARQRSCEKK